MKQELSSNNVEVKNSKQKKVAVIIAIIAVFFLIGGVAGLILLNNNSNNNKNNNKAPSNNGSSNNNASTDDITQLYISTNSIAAVDSKKELYVIFSDIYDDEYSYFGHKNEEIPAKTLMKVADDVEVLYSPYLYLDSKGNLYNTGIKHQGGVRYDFEIINSNIKSAATAVRVCYVVSSKDNQLLVQNGFTDDGYCGLTSLHIEPTVLTSDNIKEVFATGHVGGYLNNNGELFIITDNNQLLKVMDNTKDVAVLAYSEILALSNDNVLYQLTPSFGDECYGVCNIKIGNVTTLAEGVSEIGDEYYKVNDGSIYYYDTENYGSFKSNELFNYNNTTKFIKVNFDDVKEIKYLSYYKKKIIYLNNDGKVVLIKYNVDSINYKATIESQKVLDAKISNLNEIADFLYD